MIINKLKIMDPTYLSKLLSFKLRSLSLLQKEFLRFKFETYHLKKKKKHDELYSLIIIYTKK